MEEYEDPHFENFRKIVKTADEKIRKQNYIIKKKEEDAPKQTVNLHINNYKLSFR